MQNNNESKFVLFSWVFNNQGGGSEVQLNEINSNLKSKTLTWVHVNADDPNTRRWLKEEVTYLDDLILDALLDNDTRPRILEFQEGILMILRGANLNKGDDPEDMISIRLWIDKYRIISLEFRNVITVRDILANLKMGKGPKNSGEFITKLCSQLFKRMNPVLIALNEDTDNIEEQVMENPNYNERETIVTIRKQAILFRRYILPQREVLQNLINSELHWLDKVNKRYLQETYNDVQRYIEDLGAIRERSQIIKDELTNALSDRINKNLYVLSLIATTFLPLGFLTGLLGINVGGIPGANNDKAFWIFTFSLIILISLQIWLFRKFKWI